MVIVTEIPAHVLPVYVRYGFMEDQDLLDTYHLVNGTLEQCVASTVDEIKKVAPTDTLTYYALFTLDGKKQVPIGFMVLGTHCLLSFGLHIRYRNKAIIGSWWKTVLQILGDEFVTFLFKKNSRAIDFLVRNGMEIKELGTYVALIHWPTEKKVDSL